MPESLRLVQIGAGAMGQAWLATIAANPDVELVGLVGLDAELAGRAAAAHGYRNLALGTDLVAVLAEVRAEAVVNVTVPQAHRATSAVALAAGLPVLCEKPLADTVTAGQAMIGAAERSGTLLMMSQSRRYGRNVGAYRRLIARIGRIGTLTCQFFRAPRFGGFREEMAEPLLVDMAIHHFDLALLLKGSDPVAVRCDTYNPPWSWYAGHAAAEASFVFADGCRFSFSGSWCAAGAETSWNGAWRVVGGNGTALWDGDNPPVAELADGTTVSAEVGDEPESISGSLAEFVRCLRTGTRPDSAADRNIVSLAMVEASVRSALEQRLVTIAEVLGARPR